MLADTQAKETLIKTGQCCQKWPVLTKTCDLNCGLFTQHVNNVQVLYYLLFGGCLTFLIVALASLLSA